MNLAINYGAQSEIIEAVKKIKKKKKIISSKNLQENLKIKLMPNPDILIRTGGKKRSVIFCYALVYSELYFIDKLWPDFNISDYNKIIRKFKKGKKKFWKYMKNFEKRVLTLIVFPLSIFFILKGGYYIVSFFICNSDIRKLRGFSTFKKTYNNNFRFNLVSSLLAILFLRNDTVSSLYY